MLDRRELEALQMHGQDIPFLLAHWAEHKPDHPVLVWGPCADDGAGQAGSAAGRTWTYAELWADVRALAAGLRGRGLGVGDKVLIHADNCPEMVLAWLAC